MMFEQNFVVASGYTILLQRCGLAHPTEIPSGSKSLCYCHVAAAHVRFSGISQVAPVCTTPNKCASTRSPNPKRHLDRFSIASAVFAQLTAERPNSSQWPPLPPPQNCSFSYGETPSESWLVGTPKSSTHTASRSVQLFLQSSLL